MWRGYGKREFAAWTAIICLVAFGTGTVLMKRFRPVGPMEFRELSPSEIHTPTPPARIAIPEADRTRSRPTGVVAAPTHYSPQPQAPPTGSQAAAPTPTGSARGDLQGLKAEPTHAKSPAKTKPEPDQSSISLNSGELADFEKLPGVGAVIAQRIIDYRTQNGSFQSLEELRNVKGIGEKRFAKIEPFLKL